MKGINDMTKDNKVAKLNFKRATKRRKKRHYSIMVSLMKPLKSMTSKTS
jgi:hypothetical protein